MINSVEEIEKLKASSKLADDCYYYICDNIKVGMTEVEVAKLIDDYFMSHGASGVSFETIVGSGPNSALIHSVPSDRTIEFGDIVQLDFGCILDGYCSDCSRVLFMGKVDEEYKKIYDIVYEAQKFGVENAKAGMKACEVDSLCRNIVKLSGYDFNHSVGHSVGKEVHSGLVISYKNNNDIIEDGMVITIEPGIYLEGKFGIRIEDTCLVEDGKLVPLNKTSKEIVIID